MGILEGAPESRLEIARNLGTTHGGQRDIYEVLGYKKTLKFEDYNNKYKRQDITKRIIDAYPDAIWNEAPTIKELGNDFIKLAKDLKLFYNINRADKMSLLGRFSVLYFGIAGDDLSALSQPVTTGKKQVKYIMPFSEDNTTVEALNKDISNERYGQPELYTLEIANGKKVLVHESRIIHLAEGRLENDIYGIPKLETIYNRLDDLEKIVGGASEIFWINGRGGLNLNITDENVSPTNDDKDKIDAYLNSFTRVLKTKGVDIKTIDLPVHNPKEHVNVLLELIAGTLGIPKRILVGSERGELASTQDENNWHNRIEERRSGYCEEFILRPIIDKFISFGMLPNKEYDIEWAKIATLSEKERADLALKKMQTLATYLNTIGADEVVDVDTVLGMIGVEGSDG